MYQMVLRILKQQNLHHKMDKEQKIIHRPIFDKSQIKIIEDHYSKKNNTNVKYVCTSSSEHDILFGDIFYSQDIHPEFRNNYFRLFINMSGIMMIGSADWIESLNFDMIHSDSGELHYSRGRHDFNQINETTFIDGGRSYLRCSANSKIIKFTIKNGNFIREIRDEDS